ncbi:MAG: hypothetical protein ABIA21_03335 [Candidatus Aenigmatarchaeota archaeon]
MTNGTAPTEVDGTIFTGCIYQIGFIHELFSESRQEDLPRDRIRFRSSGKSYYFKKTAENGEIKYIGQW